MQPIDDEVERRSKCWIDARKSAYEIAHVRPHLSDDVVCNPRAQGAARLTAPWIDCWVVAHEKFECRDPKGVCVRCGGRRRTIEQFRSHIGRRSRSGPDPRGLPPIS